ncbi:hypothetical protein M673_00390 [Aureimonas sp. AU20]|nr:hypothetical protein M673_00390 [Aureimonas sp. AU20]
MSSMPYPTLVSAEWHPIRSFLAAFPTACFTLTLATDIAFWQTANLMWQNFSAWLLFAGLVFGGLAALGELIGLLFRRARAPSGASWPHFLGSLVVLALAFLNSLVHAGDGWTAVVPYGLALSAATVLVMLATAWLGRPAAVRHDLRPAAHFGDRRDV